MTDSRQKRAEDASALQRFSYFISPGARSFFGLDVTPMTSVGQIKRTSSKSASRAFVKARLLGADVRAVGARFAWFFYRAIAPMHKTKNLTNVESTYALLIEA